MYIIITASPNKDGLTSACGKAMYDGIVSKGGSAKIYDICEDKLKPCLVCGDGWGTCYGKAICVIDDILLEIRNEIRACEGLTLVTPVYFGQPSEIMKYFIDRFRRLEVFNEANGSAATDKMVDLIAAAGGSGNGNTSCLNEMEIWCRQVGAIMRERIGVTRYNRNQMLKVIYDAGERFVTGDYFNVKLPT